jgi:hypothetical protein
MPLYVVFVLIVWLEQLATAPRGGGDELGAQANRGLGPPLVMWLALISVWSRVHLMEDMKA